MMQYNFSMCNDDLRKAVEDKMNNRFSEVANFMADEIAKAFRNDDVDVQSYCDGGVRLQHIYGGKIPIDLFPWLAKAINEQFHSDYYMVNNISFQPEPNEKHYVCVKMKIDMQAILEADEENMDPVERAIKEFIKKKHQLVQCTIDKILENVKNGQFDIAKSSNSNSFFDLEITIPRINGMDHEVLKEATRALYARFEQKGFSYTINTNNVKIYTHQYV